MAQDISMLEGPSLWEQAKGGIGKAYDWGKGTYQEYKEKRIARNYGSTSDPYGGYIGYIGTDVGPEYVITITSNSPELYTVSNGGVRSGAGTARRQVKIRTVLQEKFEMGVESDWSPLTAASLVTNITRTVAAAAGRTPVNRWVTRRIWHGTTPLDFTLHLRFQAETDARREVLLPCQELQRMCLPYIGDKYKGTWFLSPPGPSAFQFWSPEDLGRGEIITITVGSFIRITKCVVRTAQISYDPVFQVGGMPLYATANLHFQTFEIQTKESLDTEVYVASGRADVNGVASSEVPSTTGIHNSIVE
jgi:hypothetical protein